MRATKIYPAAALLLLSLAACNNEEITPNPDARVALQVTSGIQTRAYDATWEANDEIGIFGFTQGDAPAQAYTNVRYVTRSGDGRFTHAAELGGEDSGMFFQDADETVTFRAYYPFHGNLPRKRVYRCRYNQRCHH